MGIWERTWIMSAEISPNFEVREPHEIKFDRNLKCMNTKKNSFPVGPELQDQKVSHIHQKGENCKTLKLKKKNSKN